MKKTIFLMVPTLFIFYIGAYSQIGTTKVNLQIIPEEVCYLPGSEVTVTFVTRLISSNGLKNCSNPTANSIQLRNVNYDVNITFPDMSTITVLNLKATRDSSDQGVDFSFTDVDVLNSIPGAGLPALDPCEDLDQNCELYGVCPTEYDPLNDFQADWIHTIRFTIPADMPVGDLTFSAQERVEVYSYNISTWVKQIDEVIDRDTVLSVKSFLPVNLTEFETNVKAQDVHLTWSTASEIAFEAFELQRAEYHSNFSTIATIPAQGNSPLITSNYSYLDLKLPPGTYLYRLKMVDLDGSSEHSEIKSAEISLEEKILVYPNLFQHEINLSYPFGSSLTYSIFSSNGQFIHDGTLEPYQRSVDLSGLKTGLYIFSYEAAGKKYFTKIIKQ